jgi:hypothetical protein
MANDRIRLDEIARLAPQELPVRVTIPASVAFDMGKLTEAIGNFVERLGCKPCFSGIACLLVTERDFVIDPVEGLRGVGPGAGF